MAAPVPNTAENMAKCICGNCPTIGFCAPKEGVTPPKGFYCATNATEVSEQKGCICGTCALWGEYNLMGTYPKGYPCVHEV